MKLQSALALASAGFRVFPITPNTKTPAIKGWKDKATTDEDHIRKWWKTDEDRNIGIATGNGVIVVDADCKAGKPGIESLDMLDMLGLPESFRVHTPSGGVHVYLKVEGEHRNRVDSIPDFPGIDIRTDGGYVAAPGSTIDGEHYAILSGQPNSTAPAPSWFEQHLHLDPPKRMQHSTIPLTELDTPEHVRQAIAYLEGPAHEAIEGAGGNDTTYHVATMLRDFAMSEHKALELMANHWNETKASPPWDHDDLAKIVANAFEYATGGWGARTAPAEFEALNIDIGEPPASIAPENDEFLEQPKKDKGLEFLTYDQMAAMPAPKWLVDGIVQQRTAALVFGKSNTFKSFLAIDIGLSVATGRPWHGQSVDAGPVLFVATEGANGVGRLRIPGWYDHHKVPIGERQNAYLFPREICLDQKADVDALIRACRAIGPFALIVFDIFGGTMAGSEVEDTTARAWVHSIQRVMRWTGAATLTVAHTGWQDETRARMHTHFWGSFDSRMRVEGDKAKLTTCLTVERHKDADSSGAWGFRLEAAGETLVPTYDEAVQPQKGSGWPESVKLAMRVLDEVLEAHGVVKVDPAWPSCRIVELALWRDACEDAGISASDNRETVRKAFQRARDQLVQRGAIEVQENFVWSKFDA